MGPKGKESVANNRKILAIVPAYNEEQNIGAVIREIKTKAPFVDIIVIDDGSGDRTSQVTLENGVKVLNLPFNLGIGGAVQTGLKYAAEQGYDLALQLDGDGQHDPVYIEAFISSLVSGPYDMIIGSRFLGNKSHRTPFARRLGIFIFSLILSLIIRQKITDATSGFRAFNKNLIHFFAHNYPTDYPEVEVIMLAHFAKFKIGEAPISMRIRKSGRSSITLFKSVYYVFKVMLAIFIGLLREKPQREAS